MKRQHLEELATYPIRGGHMAPAHTPLIRYVAVQLATAGLNEAATRMAELVRDRQRIPDTTWDREYAEARRDFANAHQRYRASVHDLAIHVHDLPAGQMGHHDETAYLVE